MRTQNNQPLAGGIRPPGREPRIPGRIFSGLRARVGKMWPDRLLRPPGGPVLFLLLAPLLLAPLIGAAAQNATPASGDSPYPAIRVDVRLVNVFVNVTDGKGAPVANLTRDQFLLSEDGQPQKIALFERQSQLPLNIVLAIDTSGSVRKDLSLEQEAARRFVHALLRPVDQLDLMAFSDHVSEVVPFTNGLARIDRGLDKLRPGAATALYSCVYLAAQNLEPRSGRKVIVLISDGENTVKGTSFDQAIEAAVRGEAMVYAIIDVPIAASAGRDLEGEHAMVTLSEETGGKFYYADSSSLQQSFERVSEDLRTQYLLGYYPSSRSTSGDFRTISVKLRGQPAGTDYVVHNRTGYYPQPE